jgi:dolichyl-phosphate-mannose-protein mannosyltransferase
LLTARVRLIHSVSILSRPGTQPRSRDESDPALIQKPWQRDVPRAIRLAAALAGLAVIITYLVIAVSRLTYPFTVEWLESNSLVEVHRILAGQPLYPAPAAGYVPDGYPPLYFAVSAAAASVLGVSYLPLRLVSLVSSLACFVLLGRLVHRETGSTAAGTGAAGVFAAVYFATQTWFDVGRVDSLFLALSIGGLYAARWMCRTRGAIAAGVLLAAAALTKQTGIAEGVVVLAALAFGPRRRLTCVAALAEVTVLGISTLVLGLSSGGWYIFYVFELMSEHALNYSAIGGFWTQILAVMGIAACAALIGARRAPLVLLAGCGALVVESYATLVHSGGGANDLLPAYLAVALLAGLAMGVHRAWWAAAVSGMLVLAQSLWLLSGFHPAQAIPTSADRAVGERFTAGLHALGGTIAIPGDPGLSLVAGMTPAAAHEDAAYDVLRGSDLTAITSFTVSVEHAMAAYQYSAIILDSQTPPLGYEPWLSLYYRQCPQPLLAGVPAAEFRPAAGGVTSRPFSLWLPQDRGSCQAAVSILDGSGKETP